MPTYFYTAKSHSGETVKGSIEAQDERQLAKILKSQDLILITANTDDEKKSRGLKTNISLSFLGVPLGEKILMVRNLEVMFSTGLSLVKSLEILVGQAKNQQMKDALLDIKDQVNKGQSFSDALSKYPKIFSEFFVNMIRVGEESGTLEEVFRILSLQFQREHELKSKIKNAMTYPIIIIMVMFVVGIVMTLFVLPNLKVFFSTLDSDLPIYTKILLSSSDFFAKRWYVLIFCPPVLLGIFIMILKTRQGKIALDTILLKLPLIAPIVKKSNSAFLIRSLSSLLTSGVSLITSLEISAKTVGNYHFKQAILGSVQKVKAGEKLSESLKVHHSLFPFGVIEMMEVGEETGKTSEVLKKLAEFYEQEAIASIEKLTTLIEPMLIIVLGLGAAVFAFSIIQPMYQSLDSVR